MTAARHTGDLVPRLRLRRRVASVGGMDVAGLFAGRQVGFCHLTRVAIDRAVRLLGLAPGDEVLAPAYHCGSELDPLLAAGLAVRLVPVSPLGWMDPDAVAARIGPRTRAVYVIHLFGWTDPGLGALRALCDAHGLSLIEDCALSLLSGSAPAEGRTGDVAVFSFHKHLPVSFGAALVANRPVAPEALAFRRPPPRAALLRGVMRAGAGSLPGLIAARRARRLRDDAAEAGAEPQVPALMPASYRFDPDLADRGMSRLTRALLDRCDPFAAREARRRNWLRLAAATAGLDGIAPLHGVLPPDVSPTGLALRVPDRAAVMRALALRGVEATAWWAGAHPALDMAGCAQAVALKAEVMVLPIHQQLGAAAIDRIATSLHAAMAEG